MKKLLLVCLLTLLISSNVFSQVKQRTSSSAYAGLGYSLIFFTDGDVNDTYPVFSFNNGEFLTEINPFFGFKIQRTFAIEISPSFIFTSTRNSDGFYYTNTAGSRSFYKPQEANLFALPLNVNLKFFPFASDALSTLSNAYVGVGGGTMYIREEYLNYLYSDSTAFFYQGSRTDKNSFWKPNFQAMVGYGSTSQFGYNFELSYRHVPLDQKKDFPLVTSIAKNFSSINLSVRINFNF